MIPEEVQALVDLGFTVMEAHIYVFLLSESPATGYRISRAIGKPVANMLLQKKEHANATVTICHTRTKDIAHFTRQADIVIAAAGRPNTITADMVREGVVIIDVGVNRVEDASAKRGYRLVGACDFAGLRDKAALITPVPGGVGPMTITMLLHNTVESARRAAGLE